jgi:acetolactate synthase I/II/III large subunit
MNFQSAHRPLAGRVAAKPYAVRRGAEVLAETLVELGVTTVFCYPGGANLEILDALSGFDVHLLRTEHEQGAVFAAQGYARATGRLGVCLATSGPGATNIVTGIADANSDSVPILCITGNVATRWLGRNAFQEVDIVAVTKPITKLSRQVRQVEEIRRALLEAATIALGDRPGPVLLDFPKDVQQQVLSDAMAPRVPLNSESGEKRDSSVSCGTESIYSRITELLSDCKRPMIYAGGGIIAADQCAALTCLAESLRCPVALTLMGLGAMDPAHPLYLGPLGMHGSWCANVAVNEADVVLALGVRFDDRVIGDPNLFASDAKIVHIDVDARELGKNKPIHLGVCADLREAFPQLLRIAKPVATEGWLAYLAAAAQARPLQAASTPRLTGPQAIATLSGRLPDDVIVTTGVGQHQMWAMQYLKPRKPRGFLSSSGFGTMGFGLPAAIGAKRGVPEATVVDIDGDGSLNMTINELSTCHRHGLGVKVFVVNNQWLGMVRQWQDMIYAGNRVASALSDPLELLGSSGGRAPYPDFLAIAAGYRVRSERVVQLTELPEALTRFLADPNEPYLLDIMVDRESNVLPMIPSGKGYRDTVFKNLGAGIYET